MVDLWPRKVARFAESKVAGVLPLEGNPDATGPLVTPKEAGSGKKTLKDACSAYESIAWALAELRPYLPDVPDPPPRVTVTGLTAPVTGLTVAVTAPEMPDQSAAASDEMDMDGIDNAESIAASATGATASGGGTEAEAVAAARGAAGAGNGKASSPSAGSEEEVKEEVEEEEEQEEEKERARHGDEEVQLCPSFYLYRNTYFVSAETSCWDAVASEP